MGHQGRPDAVPEALQEKTIPGVLRGQNQVEPAVNDNHIAPVARRSEDPDIQSLVAGVGSTILTIERFAEAMRIFRPDRRRLATAKGIEEEAADARNFETVIRGRIGEVALTGIRIFERGMAHFIDPGWIQNTFAIPDSIVAEHKA